MTPGLSILKMMCGCGSVETCGVDIGFYTTRERSLDEVFPWDFIDAGVSKEFLIREWNHAVKEEVTPNCRQRCSGCGARDLAAASVMKP